MKSKPKLADRLRDAARESREKRSPSAVATKTRRAADDSARFWLAVLAAMMGANNG